MMVLPFLMIMVLPKLINTQDPETQKVNFELICTRINMFTASD